MPVYQTLPLFYDLGSNPSPTASRWVQQIGGVNLTSQTQFVRAETPRFAVAFQDGATGIKVQTNLGTVTAWAFTVKALNNYGGATLLYSTTAPTITGTGATTLYTFALSSYNTTQLADAFIILDEDIESLGDDGQLPTLPANQAARYALTGLALGYVVRQVDTGTYWKVIDTAELDNSAGWSNTVAQRSYVDCGLQIDFTISGVTDKTRALPVRISNDYAQTAAGASPIGSFPVFVDADDVLISPTAAELVAANPELGGGSSSEGNTVTVDVVFGDDYTGTREGLPFLTLAAAKAGANSGDEIVARSGTYTDAGIQKAGVNYNLTSATLAHTSTTTLAPFFTDAAGTFSSRVHAGDIGYTQSGVATVDTGAVVNLENASSDVYLSARNITGAGTGGNALSVAAGKLSANFDSLTTAGSAAWWSNGDMFLTGNSISGGVYTVYGRVAAGATMTGKLWVDVKYIHGTDYPGIDIATSDNSTGSGQVYVNAQEITGTQGVVKVSGCKVYVTAGKLTNSSANVYAVQNEAGEAWVTTQKIQGGIASIGGSAMASFLYLKVDDWMDSLGGTAAAITHGGDNSDAVIEAGTLKAVTSLIGIETQGGIGTITFSGTLDFSAVAGSNPVHLYDNATVIRFIGNPRLIAYAGRASIIADNPATVYGHFIANTAIGANVTAADGYTLDNGTTSVEFLPNLTLANALPLTSGGTGATTAAGARTALGAAIAPIVAADYTALLTVTPSAIGQVAYISFGRMMAIAKSLSTGDWVVTNASGLYNPDFTSSVAFDGTRWVFAETSIGIGGGTLNVSSTVSTTITGGGTLALGGFTLTVPAAGTAALLGTAQTFVATKTFAAIDATSIGATTPGSGVFTIVYVSGAAKSVVIDTNGGNLCRFASSYSSTNGFGVGNVGPLIYSTSGTVDLGFDHASGGGGNTTGAIRFNGTVYKFTSGSGGAYADLAIQASSGAFSGTATATGGIIYGTYTVGTFPTTTYLEAVVTDALAPVQGAPVASGGSAKCKVMYNGSAKIVTAVL